MTSPQPPRADGDFDADSENETTGLPRLRTWRGVYTFVAVCFVIYVIVFALLPRLFA
ncbi:MAG: hypothetical protein Q8M02_15935 [Candidatus Didemnitutus sp.]|nr:hypothetical protein [Candidatus Didemnitutus sp.]